MSWSYRVVHQTIPSQSVSADEEYYEIYEVFYDDDGNPNGYGDAHPGGEDIEELRDELLLMIDAVNQPVLEMKDLDEHTDWGAPLEHVEYDNGSKIEMLHVDCSDEHCTGVCTVIDEADDNA